VGYEYTNPKLTIRLLDWLVERGLSEKLFSYLHQFDEQTIAQHRAHCENAEIFSPGSAGARVQKRLYYLEHMIKEATKPVHA
jgi:hypothetical protein